MKVSEHITYGAAASIGLSHWFGWNSIWFFIGSVAIDFDHYFEFLYYHNFRSFSFKKMFKWYGYLNRFVNNTDYLVLHAYHTIEFLLVTTVLVQYFHSMELAMIFLGMIFHITLDRIRMRQNGLLNIRANSFLEYWLRKKKMLKELGTEPEYIFRVHSINFRRYNGI